jgi:hypothetical protein
LIVILSDAKRIDDDDFFRFSNNCVSDDDSSFANGVSAEFTLFVIVLTCRQLLCEDEEAGALLFRKPKSKVMRGLLCKPLQPDCNPRLLSDGLDASNSLREPSLLSRISLFNAL